MKPAPANAIRRAPTTSITIPVSGASRPCSKLRSENPKAIAETLQPSSARIGSMKMLAPIITKPSTRKLLNDPAIAMYQP